MNKVILTCKNCNISQEVVLGSLEGVDDTTYAKEFASLIDGTNDLYVSSPRDDPNSMIAHCINCGGLIDATVELL